MCHMTHISMLANIKMKYGIISIVLALSGVCFVVWYNYEFSQWYIDFALKFDTETGYVLSNGMTNWTNKSIAIGVSIIVLYLGIKSYRMKKRIGLFGIGISILLLFLVFLPLWSHFI